MAFQPRVCLNDRVADKRKRGCSRLVYQLVSRYLNPCWSSLSPALAARSSLVAFVSVARRNTIAAARARKRGALEPRYTLMDRARSFATIGRALYMAHGAPRFPISVKVQKRSRSPSERELCALEMDFTVSTNEK